MRVGVLALQGAVIEHLHALREVGAEALELRDPQDLQGLDGIILPGGESTTIGMLLQRFHLLDPLVRRAQAGMPVWGTCAGMILLARHIRDGLPDQVNLGLMDMTVQRNAYGRQVESFVAPLKLPVVGSEPFPGVFIRAPLALEWGPEVEVLARHEGQAVALRQGHLLATSFHPELARDHRFHGWFVREFIGATAVRLK